MAASQGSQSCAPAAKVREPGLDNVTSPMENTEGKSSGFRASVRRAPVSPFFERQPFDLARQEFVRGFAPRIVRDQHRPRCRDAGPGEHLGREFTFRVKEHEEFQVDAPARASGRNMVPRRYETSPRGETAPARRRLPPAGRVQEYARIFPRVFQDQSDHGRRSRRVVFSQHHHAPTTRHRAFHPVQRRLLADSPAKRSQTHRIRLADLRPVDHQPRRAASPSRTHGRPDTSLS